MGGNVLIGIMSIAVAFCKSADGPNIKKVGNFEKNDSTRVVNYLEGGDKVFPNLEHEKSVNVSRRRVRKLIFSFFLGQKLKNMVLRPIYGKKAF
jgi:hypothetical protein